MHMPRGGLMGANIPATDTIHFDKETLLVELNARLAWAVEYDKSKKAEQKEEAKVALEKFRTKLREALKWSIEHAAKQYSITTPQHASCEASVKDRLKKAIAVLRLDDRKQITINAHGDHFLFWVLTQEYDKPVTCS